MQLKQAAIIKQVPCTAAVLALLLATACTAPTERPDGENMQPAPVVEASAPAMPAEHSDEAEASVADVESTSQSAPAAEPTAESAPSPEPEASAPTQPGTPEPVETVAAASTEEAPAAQVDPPAPAPEPEPETKPAPATAAAPGQSEEPTEAPTPEPAQPKPAPAPQAQTMDLDGLETRLRKTKAIGLFTKLELKSQVGDLLEDVENYHRARSSLNLDQLEEHFNLLVMKLLVLLEQDDPQLHRDIARARPALWTTLADPEQFLSVRGP